MLVLSRKEAESVSIFTTSGEVITINVERLNGSCVKLSFECPDSVDIWRNELLEEETQQT